ncbi:MAG: hypothetical protein EA397_04980 [Deltaproteobacteria bacterium]|nr:MAG: hypothetical protein EA397_04980 [Deltaproteobacteria bacterium]
MKHLPAIFLGLALVGCNGDDTTLPSGTDSSSSASHEGYSSLSGSISFESVIGGIDSCDYDLSFTGTPEDLSYPEYDLWQFALDTNVTTDRSGAQCADDVYAQVFGLRTGDMVPSLSLAYEVYSDDAGSQQSALWLYSTSIEIPWVATELGHNLSVDGDTFTFSAMDEFEDVTDEVDNSDRFINECQNPAIRDFDGDPISPDIEAVTLGGTFDCDLYAVEIFEIDVPESGEVTLTVDAPNAALSFDPVVALKQPDGDECTLAFSDDNFDCTGDEQPFCAGVGPIELDAGTYELHVMIFTEQTTAACADDTVEYEIGGVGPAGLTITAADERYQSRELTLEMIELDISGSLTLAQD